MDRHSVGDSRCDRRGKAENVYDHQHITTSGCSGSAFWTPFKPD
jgi:hypothetical protein